MAKRKYTIYKRVGSKRWGVLCHSFNSCPFLPSGQTHQEAVAIMDSHEYVWHCHIPSNNTTKENSNV